MLAKELNARFPRRKRRAVPAVPSPDALAEWEKRSEGWIDRALSGEDG